MNNRKGEIITIIALITTITLGLTALISSQLVNIDKLISKKSKATCYIDRFCILNEGVNCNICDETEVQTTQQETESTQTTNNDSTLNALVPLEPVSEIIIIPTDTPISNPSQTETNFTSNTNTQQNTTSGNLCFNEVNGEKFQVDCSQVNYQPPVSQQIIAPNPCPKEGTYYDDTYGSCMPIVATPFEMPTLKPEPPPGIFQPFIWFGDRLGDLGGIKDEVTGNKPHISSQPGTDLPSGLHPTIVPTSAPWFGTPWDWVSDRSKEREQSESTGDNKPSPPQTGTYLPLTTPTPVPEKPWWENIGNMFNQPSISPSPSTSPLPTSSNTNNPTTVPTTTVNKPFTYETYVESHTVNDQNGVPTKVITQKGNEIVLDQKAKDLIVKYRNNDNKYKEPELITEKTVALPSTSIKPTNSIEHPILKELPKDVLSNDDLKKRGINIYQANISNLYIRESAFTGDGPLATFAKYKEMYPDAELNIILVDSTTAYNTNAISDKNVPDAIMSKLRQTSITDQQVEDYKNLRINAFSNFLEQNRQKYKDAIDNNDKDRIYTYASQIIYNKLQLEDEKNKSSDDIRLKLANTGNAAGLFYSGVGTTKHSATITMGVKNTTSKDYSITGIFINPDGKITDINALSTGFPVTHTIDSSTSRPDPASFNLNKNADPNSLTSYPYAQNISQVLRHEINHFNLIQYRGALYWEDFLNWQITEYGKPADQQAPWPKNTSTRSEYITDMAAMDEITKAWEKCKASNFTNCSDYSFIFSLPNNGGFIEGNLKDKNNNPKMKL